MDIDLAALPDDVDALQRIVCTLAALRLHGRTQLAGDDVAREVIQDRAEIEPAPASHLELGEVRLPELVGRRCHVLKFVGRLHARTPGTDFTDLDCDAGRLSLPLSIMARNARTAVL